MSITGSSRILFVLADPVKQVVGTVRMNHLFGERGIDAVIVPLHVHPSDLGAAVEFVRRTPNVAGFTSTIPHKQTVLTLMDALTDRAALCGAVNWTRRNADGTLTGENLDGMGFVAGLGSAGVAPAGTSVVMFGAGGVARAIAVSLLDAGVRRLDVVNRNHRRAQELVRDLLEHADGSGSDRLAAVPAPVGEYDIVVNATSLGLDAADPDPAVGIDFTCSMVAADVINSARPTRFLRRAGAAGATTIAGCEMLTPQLDAMLDFLGLRARTP